MTGRLINADRLKIELMKMSADCEKYIADKELPMLSGLVAAMYLDVITAVSREQTVDAVPVRHGKWINRKFDMATCSCCGDRWGSTSVMKYCPSCGAKMDAQEKEDDRTID